MTANPNVSVAIRYFEALSSKDLHALPLAPDVVMESPVTPRLRGVASVLEYLEGLASIAKTIRTLDFIAEGNKVVVEFEIETADAVIPGFECLEISDGLIKKLRPYFDARPLTDGAAPNRESRRTP
jgi:ketosteroid isomerase-like protein